jgi:EAL domain-containing protein (putative c-di-GMP-specific phosphodiesterase class I)
VCVGVGIYRYRPDVSVSELLTRADTALLKANVDECNHIHVYKEQYAKESLSKTQWRNILEESIKENHFKIKFFSAINSQTKAIVHKVITFNIVTNNAKEYQYSEFIAPAINLGMTTVLYLKMLEHFFIQQKKDIDTTRYVIRLPKELLQDEDSFEALSHLFVKYAKKIKYRLCFEVTDSFAIHDTATVKGYIDLFKKYNFCFSINSFTGGANDFEYLKEINPEYIKADVNFLLDQSNNSMSALQLIADSLNIEIIANFVNSEEEVKQLQKHQITKIQGPIVDIF